MLPELYDQGRWVVKVVLRDKSGVITSWTVTDNPPDTSTGKRWLRTKERRWRDPVASTDEEIQLGIEGRVRMLRQWLSRPWFVWLVLFLLTTSQVHFPPGANWRGWMVVATWFVLVFRLVVVLLTS